MQHFYIGNSFLGDELAIEQQLITDIVHVGPDSLSKHNYTTICNCILSFL